VAQLDPRHVRLFGPAFALWDVRDVEAHVRTLLDAQLRVWGARLDAAKYDDALAYLVDICWRLSGLQGNGRTQRIEHFAVLVSGEIHLELGPFPSRDRAESAVSDWRVEQDVPPAIAVTYLERRPVGAYDPKQGLAFSTYSRRILSRRVVDWYRHTFGDNRYGGNPKPLSLDQLVDDWENRNDGSGAAESYLDHNGPGARLDFIDELNRHAYYDPFEERDTRSITDTGGTDRAAAAG
jgi:hypothetical protein